MGAAVGDAAGAVLKTAFAYCDSLATAGMARPRQISYRRKPRVISSFRTGCSCVYWKTHNYTPMHQVPRPIPAQIKDLLSPQPSICNGTPFCYTCSRQATTHLYLTNPMDPQEVHPARCTVPLLLQDVTLHQTCRKLYVPHRSGCCQLRCPWCQRPPGPIPCSPQEGGGRAR